MQKYGVGQSCKTILFYQTSNNLLCSKLHKRLRVKRIESEKYGSASVGVVLIIALLGYRLGEAWGQDCDTIM